MQTSPPRMPAVIYTAIEQVLDAHADGIREYDLLGILKARGFFAFLPEPPAEPHQLFRAHFLLFHALYELADRLASQQQGLLQINALCIRRMPWTAGEHALCKADPLRAWYLDWGNLDGTTPADVSALIASFWKQLGGFDRREEALAELGLADPVDDETIKLAWRRLAMAHHPDRGGDNERLQAIIAAVGRLIR